MIVHGKTTCVIKFLFELSFILSPCGMLHAWMFPFFRYVFMCDQWLALEADDGPGGEDLASLWSWKPHPVQHALLPARPVQHHRESLMVVPDHPSTAEQLHACSESLVHSGTSVSSPWSPMPCSSDRRVRRCPRTKCSWGWSDSPSASSTCPSSVLSSLLLLSYWSLCSSRNVSQSL